MFILIILFLRCRNAEQAEGVKSGQLRDWNPHPLQTPLVGVGWGGAPAPGLRAVKALCLCFLISPGHRGGRDIRGQKPQPPAREEKAGVGGAWVPTGRKGPLQTALPRDHCFPG